MRSPEEPEPPTLTSIGEFYHHRILRLPRSACGKDPSHPAYGIHCQRHRGPPRAARSPRTQALYQPGTVVYFEGIDGLTGGYIAEDTGSAIKGNKIDLYFDSHQDALEWGVQSREVFVIE